MQNNTTTKDINKMTLEELEEVKKELRAKLSEVEFQLNLRKIAMHKHRSA